MGGSPLPTASFTFTRLYSFILCTCGVLILTHHSSYSGGLNGGCHPFGLCCGQGSEYCTSPKPLAKFLLPSSGLLLSCGLWRSYEEPWVWEVVKVEIMCMWCYIILCVYGAHFSSGSLVRPCADV